LFALWTVVILLSTCMAALMVLNLAVIRRLRSVAESLRSMREGGTQAVNTGLKAHEVIPAFEARTVDGGVVTSTVLSQAGGLLAFFAAECPTCRTHMSALATAAQKQKGASPLTLVVVAGDAMTGADLIGMAKGFAKVAVEPDFGPISSAFQVGVFPTFFRLGKDGAVASKTHVAQEALAAFLAPVSGSA